MAEYDIMIIGAGPAGLTAGLYAARAGMKAAVLEKASAGGEVLLTEIVENFPGFPEGIKGHELAERFRLQALKAGLKIINEEVKEISFAGRGRYTVKAPAKSYAAAAIIIASGAHPRKLGVAGEDKFIGRGVSYCAICDGPLFRQRQVLVVGGGNAACEEALYLSKFARKVTLIHRRDRLRADKVLQERMKAEPKIDVIWSSRVLEMLGEVTLSGVKLEQIKTGKTRDLSCEGVFIFVGLKPNTDFLKGLVKMDKQGFIVSGQNLQTSRKGIFACGDCRQRPLRQIITAAGEGAEAAVAARDYVEEARGTAYA